MNPMNLATAALCRDVFIDQLTQAFSFINILEYVFVSSLPTNITDIKLGALWSVESANERQYTVHAILIRPDGSMETLLKRSVTNFTPPFHKMYMRIANIALHVEGLYRIALETTVQGATCRHAELPFIVGIRREPTQAEDANERT